MVNLKNICCVFIFYHQPITLGGCFFCFCLWFFSVFILREHKWAGEGQREVERIPIRPCTGIQEPDVGLDPTNCEIRTSAKIIGWLTEWVTLACPTPTSCGFPNLWELVSSYMIKGNDLKDCSSYSTEKCKRVKNLQWLFGYMF